MKKFEHLLKMEDSRDLFKAFREILVNIIDSDPEDYYSFLAFLDLHANETLRDTVERIIKSGEASHGLSVASAIVMWHYDYDHPGFLNEDDERCMDMDVRSLSTEGRDAMIAKFGITALRKGIFS